MAIYIYNFKMKIIKSIDKNKVIIVWVSMGSVIFLGFFQSLILHDRPNGVYVVRIDSFELYSIIKVIFLKSLLFVLKIIIVYIILEILIVRIVVEIHIIHVILTVTIIQLIQIISIWFHLVVLSHVNIICKRRNQWASNF
jgi:hypothetical protein